ncbi:MAG: histidine kinase dimerization/phospho-acceptor domain-containing protein [Peptostreptococcaceae bacterium]
MFKYINIITLSILLMCIYVIYGRWSGKKSRVNTMLMFILSTIMISKFVFVTYNDKSLSIANLSYTYEILIVLFIFLLKIKNDKLDRLIFSSYILALISIIMMKMDAKAIYIQLISMYMLMSTLYLFYMACSLGLSNKYKAISILYFGHISISLILNNNIEILSIGCSIDFVLSILLFIDIFKLSVIDVVNKNVNTIEKLNKFSIKMELKEDKIYVNQHITETLNQSLVKKQNLLDTIVGQCDKCVIVVDANGFIVNEDESFIKMWNEYKDNKNQLHINKFLNDNIKNPTTFIKCINTVNETEKSIEEEIEGTDGRYFNCTYSPCLVGNKNIGTICYIIDITYMKKSKQRIKENNTKYKAIVDNIPYPILLADEDNIIYDNKKYESVNLDKNKINDITLNDTNNGEIKYKNNTNNDVYLNIDRVSFMDDESIKKLVVIRDITSYKELLAKVESSNEKHESLVNLIPEGIYILDFESKALTYANDVFLNMANADCIENIKLEDVGEGLIITSVNKNESIRFQRKTIKHKNKEEIHVECGGMVIEVNKKLKLVGVIRDITEQVKTEQIEIEIEKAKLEYKNKNEFFVNMSHELKTPLNLISSSNQLLEALGKDEIKKNPNSNLSTTIKCVKNNAYMVMGLINNIMDLSKLEQDFHQYKKDYYNMVDIVDDICMNFSEYIANNNVEIIFDTDEEEKIVNIDPDDIEKVVLTLLSFVIRYSDDDSNVSIELKKEGNEDILEIKNEGGYDYNKYNLDTERRSLDIAIELARQIIELYSGSISITSNQEKNVIVSVKINIDKDKEEYKEREKNNNLDYVYSEYIRMCNF